MQKPSIGIGKDPNSSRRPAIFTFSSRLRGGTRDTAWKKLSEAWCKEEQAESLRTLRPHNPLVLRARF
jgi:hypothetical protein